MSILTVSALVFACVFGSALLGMYIRRLLPEEHLNADTRQVIGLSMGLVGTLAALLLALVTTSAKDGFDSENGQVRQGAVNVLMLDRLLADFGAETTPIRQAMRQAVARRLELTWPRDHARAVVLQSTDTDAAPLQLVTRIRQLQPQTDTQRELRSQAVQLAGEIMRGRWIALEEAQVAMPPLFLVIVVCWLSLLFASFGLFAPANATAAVVLLIGSLSVAASVFLILELDTPFSGLMKVSDAPLRFALAELGR